MELIKIVKDLEGNEDNARRKVICDYLNELGINYAEQKYISGTNVIASSGKNLEVGVSSHFDAVVGSPGANDNASAVAVTIEVLRRYHKSPLDKIGICGFFFDEEEYGLVGSHYYVKNNPIDRLLGDYNMELVGNGDKVAFWSDGGLHNGLLLKTIKKQARALGIQTKQFPYTRKTLGLQNSADHISFNESGIKESFSITAITQNDVDIVKSLLFNPLNWINPKRVNVNEEIQKSDVFRHYHQKSDTSKHINEKTMQMVSDLVYGSICAINNKIEKNN